MPPDPKAAALRLDGHLKTDLRQTRRLGQTAQLAVQLSSLAPGDLLETLKTETAENPFLLVQPPRRRARTTAPPTRMHTSEPEAYGPGLVEHVLRQVDGLVPQKEDRRLARALIEELDATGYLVETTSQIARRCGVPVAQLETVLHQMRRAEPPGLFARDLAECLSLQLEDEGTLTPEFCRLLARLSMIASGEKPQLAQQCGVTPTRLTEMLAHLRRLDPRPGASFGWHPAPNLIPELLFLHSATGWDVQLNPEAQPGLGLDHSLHHSLRGCESPDLAAAWTRAQHLVRALDLRNRSLLAVGRCILAHQSAAIADAVSDQSPLTRRGIAAEIGLHETTVGRIVKHAAARVEGRSVALAQFFGRPTATDSAAGGVSHQRLVSLISTCLEQQGKGGRVTDSAITLWLADRNITVARRTVAKYRQQVKPGRRSMV